MSSLVKARAVGGSLVVTIPKEIVESEEIREGDIVKIALEKIRKSYYGAAKGIGSFTAQDEMKAHE